MQEARKILVLYGGNSSEREVSLKSGTAINQALTNLGLDSELLDFQNNLEFFSSSSSENPLFKNVSTKIESIEKKIEFWRDKLKKIEKV